MMSSEQKYSVLMSLYIKEKPEHFRVALDSMLHQTVKPDEIVIVEDGPLTEALYAALDAYESCGVTLHRVRNEQNLGLGLALNVGLKACSNELVARMDTDDIAKPERCEKQLRYMLENPATAIVGGQIEEFIDQPENIVGKRIVPTTNMELQEYLKQRCPFNHMTVMFKKSCVEAAGSYQDWFCNEDYYLWIRMAQKGMTFGNLGDIIVRVRVGRDMYNRRGGKKYFDSEIRLQKYMRANKVIGFSTFVKNSAKRFIVQVLLPNSIRGWVFRRFAREKS